MDIIPAMDKMTIVYPTQRTDDEWREILPAARYRVLREQGTERAFSGDLWDEHRTGSYRCAGCGSELFDSTAKFESGTGWPSFHSVAAPTAVERREDRSFLMRRTEVNCATCGGHLGHVFDDGPRPTGMRYCINSAALEFQPDDGAGDEAGPS